MFELDGRVRLVVPNGTDAQTIGWVNDFLDKIRAGAVGDLSEYLSVYAPRLLIKTHDQCILFMHLFFNEAAYSLRAQDNIFAFIYANNEAPPSARLPPPSVEGRGSIANFLLQSSALFGVDPLVFMLCSPTYFPIARYYFQFTLRTSSTLGAYFGAAELSAISFLDANKSALAQFHASFWSPSNLEQLAATFGRGSSDSVALAFTPTFPTIGALIDSIESANTFIAYFFYFLNNGTTESAPAHFFRDMVQNLLKARFSLGQLLASAVDLPSIEDYARVNWAALDANFFAPDRFVHYLFPSVSITRSRLIDYTLPPNDMVRNISVFNGQLVSTSTVSNLGQQDFAGWKTYFSDGSGVLSSDEVYFNRICRIEDFFLFESTYVRNLFLLATSKLNLRIERLAASDSGSINVFASFAGWPPITNRRLVTFTSRSLPSNPTPTLRVVDVASSETLLEEPLTTRTRLAFRPAAYREPPPFPAQGPDTALGLSHTDFWSSFMYRLEFAERRNPATYCVSSQTGWGYVISILNTAGNSLVDSAEPNIFRSTPNYVNSRRHFEPVDFATNQYVESGARVAWLVDEGDDPAFWAAMPTHWPGRAEPSSVVRNVRVTTPSGATSELLFKSGSLGSFRAAPFIVFAKEAHSSAAPVLNTVSASVLNAGCCDSLQLAFFCDSSYGARLVYFELEFAVTDTSLDVAEYLAVSTDSKAVATLLEFRQLVTGPKNFIASVLVYDLKANMERTSCVFSVANTVFLCQVQFVYKNGSSPGDSSPNNPSSNSTSSNSLSILTTFIDTVSITGIFLVRANLSISKRMASIAIALREQETLTIQQSSTGSNVNCTVVSKAGRLMDTWAYPSVQLPLRVDVLVSSSRNVVSVYCVLFSSDGEFLDKKKYKIGETKEICFIQILDEKQNNKCKKTVYRSERKNSSSTSYFLV